ncbi:hypothetical protein Poli38472_013928 [Pythium oligandrum]|uniref:PWI domain-containing protein n=1 Tax=Pythium oligandrum TaxID=41045 RepID=A0A8K1C2C1_PYTOL|nr:hypothetical protein Poli38472_013928 [Pythium oligandrum]|eukprot:TMW55166.1 hypothetical protein Poli38472_013928 [Pythium oligandrum]
MSFFRGTSIDQDSRYFSQHKKLLAKLTFPPCFDQKVDLAKVKLEVINQWVTERVTQILGFEDDIVVSMIINLLEPKVDQKLDPREMQITITGFLEKEAPSFMKELWELLLSAQAHPTGIPAELLEKKKQEMAKAAKEKADLRQVLDRKQQEAGHARPAGPRREGRGGRGRVTIANASTPSSFVSKIVIIFCLGSQSQSLTSTLHSSTSTLFVVQVPITRPSASRAA